MNDAQPARPKPSQTVSYLILGIFGVLALGVFALARSCRSPRSLGERTTELTQPIDSWNRAVSLGNDQLAQESVDWRFWSQSPLPQAISGRDLFLEMVTLGARFVPVSETLPRYAPDTFVMTARLVDHGGIDFGERWLVLARDSTDDTARYFLAAVTTP